MRTQRPALGGASQRSQGSAPVASQPLAVAVTSVNAVRPAPGAPRRAYLIVVAAEAAAARCSRPATRRPLKISTAFSNSTEGALET